MNWRQEVLDHINHLLEDYDLRFSSLDNFVQFAEAKLGHKDQDVLNLKVAIQDAAKLPPESH